MLVHVTDQAVAQGVTPGGIIYFGEGETPARHHCFGSLDYQSGAPVNVETVYDIASITKSMATAAVAMRLVQDGVIELDTPARSLLPELDSRIEIRHLLGHGAGFPAHRRFYETLRGSPSPRDELYRLAAAEPLEYVPGRKTIYSDLGYILLAFALERASDRGLAELTRTLVCEPLALVHTRFVDHGAGESLADLGNVAPTEECPERSLVRGQVHDENAHAAGGVCGHAGLFSTGQDVATFAQAFCELGRGRAVAGFDPDVVTAFMTTAAAPRTSWRLGFDTPSSTPGVSHAGDGWSREHGVGHLGFTGCSMWLDPPRRRYAVLLTNRVHPTRDGTGIRELRRQVMDAIVTELDR